MGQANSRAETIHALRRTIVGLADLRRPAALFDATTREKSLFSPLLAGRRLFGGLHEIVPAAAPDRSTALAFALQAAAACLSLRPHGACVLVTEDFVVLETGVPYGLGLAGAGLDPARLLLVRTQGPRETLLAMETALRCRAVAAVIGESLLPPRRYDLVTSRRLLLAARAGGGAALLLPLAFAGHASRLSSAATARFEIARGLSAALPYGASRLPMPGQPAFRMRVLKAPGALTDAAARARDRWREGVFGVPIDEAAYAFSGHSFSLPADGPHPAHGDGEPTRRIA